MSQAQIRRPGWRYARRTGNGGAVQAEIPEARVIDRRVEADGGPEGRSRMNKAESEGVFTPDAGGYPPILTTAMAADLLHVHVEYLRRMVREGRIPAHRFPGGREIRFHRDELIEWVRAQPGEDRSPSATRSDA